MKLKQQFFESIKCGTGQAYLLLTKHPKVDFSKYIIKAATHNYAYDAQSEGSRADYIWTLTQAAPQQKKIKKAMRKALAQASKDSWDLKQLFDLVALMAKEGNIKALQAVYARYEKDSLEDGRCQDGETAILEMNGIQGLKFMLEVKGKYLAQHPENEEDGYLEQNFQENNPQLDVQAELQKTAKQNPHIRLYLDTVAKYKETHDYSTFVRIQPNYQSITNRINSKEGFYMNDKIAQEISKQDALKLAQDFLKQTIASQQEKYLRIFSKIVFPYGYKPVLQFVMAESTRRNEYLLDRAIAALSLFEHSEIRALALEKLKEKRYWTTYCPLLANNYRAEDMFLISKMIEQTDSQDNAHSLVYSLIQIYQQNPTPLCQKPLELMYRKLRCGIHRQDLVEILSDNQALSPKILKELQYDSNQRVRELYIHFTKK